MSSDTSQSLPMHSCLGVSESASVTCSWSILNERRIEDAVSFEVADNCEGKRSLERVVSLETCVQLGDQNQSVPCMLDVKLKKEGLFVTEACVVSEARIIEVYGKCGEYITTSHSEFLDECEGMIVYTADIKLPQGLTECSFKFARVKTRGQMWLYGIHMFLEKDTATKMQTSVNFNNVNKMLKESSHQLTEKADRCKKFLQMYSSYRDSSTSASEKQSAPSPQTLLKMLDAVYLTPRNNAGEQAKGVPKCLTDLLPSLTSFSKVKSENNYEKCTTVPSGKIPTCGATGECIKFVAEELKSHIDKRFNELATSLTLSIDEKLNELQREQNEKIEKILNLVQNLNKA